MTDMLVIPPIRTGLQEGDDVGQTAKEWYYFWRNESEQTNANRIKLDGLVTSGTHAERPDAEDMPEGALYIETDRGAIYQNQDGVWQYLAGTMWGTLSPDQRPADLGVNDAGFDFRGTDQAREFIWSQTAWIEATPVRYGTHAARPASPTVADGVIYVETDRGNVIYQQQADAWHYVGGTMFGTLSPDQRPAGLGVNDSGFLFQTTDSYELYRWSGTAWVNQTLSNLALYAQATSSLALTATLSDIPGASVSIARPGRYIAYGVISFNQSVDIGAAFIGYIAAPGIGNSAPIIFRTPNAPTNTLSGGTVAQTALFTVTAVPQTVKLQALKSGGAGGSSTVDATQTTLTVVWLGP